MLLLQSPFGHSSASARLLNNIFDDLDRSTSSIIPYWNNADHSSFSSFSNTIGEIVNNDQHFGLQIDVSHFRPENLKVELNGRELNIEGEEETKSEHGYSKRSFSRKVLLPEDADLTSVKSHITNDGKLSLEVSKKQNTTRQIPINFINHNTTTSSQ